MVSPNTSKLQKENDKLKSKVNNISKELEELKTKVSASGIMAAADSLTSSKNEDLEKSVQFLSDEYDQSKGIAVSLRTDFERLSSELRCIKESLTKFEEAIEAINQYSYQYNLKILGVPQVNTYEPAQETADICLKIFKQIGAKVEESDIDIAHRMPTKPDSNYPPTIICKFTRRLAKESVIQHRKNAIDLSKIGIQPSLNKIIFCDHLTPKSQQLFNQAKLFQRNHGYQYCWTKNSTILLKETPSSKVIRVTGPEVLNNLEDDVTEGAVGGTAPPWRRLWSPPDERPRTRSRSRAV